MNYPSREAETEILARYGGVLTAAHQALESVRVIERALLGAARAEAEQVHVAEALSSYVLDLARATREHPRVALGLSTRGALALLKAARVNCGLRGADFVTPDDVKHVAELDPRAPPGADAGSGARYQDAEVVAVCWRDPGSALRRPPCILRAAVTCSWCSPRCWRSPASGRAIRTWRTCGASRQRSCSWDWHWRARSSAACCRRCACTARRVPSSDAPRRRPSCLPTRVAPPSRSRTRPPRPPPSRHSQRCAASASPAGGARGCVRSLAGGSRSAGRRCRRACVVLSGWPGGRVPCSRAKNSPSRRRCCATACGCAGSRAAYAHGARSGQGRSCISCAATRGVIRLRASTGRRRRAAGHS